MIKDILKYKVVEFVFLVFFVILQADSNAQNPKLIKTGILWAPFIEWRLTNSTFNGNPFDLVATVTFVHQESGKTISTGMFYDGGTTWKFRFTGTKTGLWTFTTSSKDSDLDGHFGTVIIKPNPDPEAAGFVTHFGNKWGRTGTNQAFVPQYVMYASPHVYYNNPDKIDADIQTFLVEHGFNGFHTLVFCRWFDLNEPDYENIEMPNPDFRTFEALELLITKVYRAGGVVHIWAWGDEQRKQTPIKWGKNGLGDKRLQRYIAARLGPLPGWTMGYGFDLDEWVTEEDLREWHTFMQQQMGWFHFLGGRDPGPTPPGEPFKQLYEGLDYASYTQHRPDYNRYVETIEARPQKPSFSEDRFRIRLKATKDYNLEDTRRGLWHSTMAGGVANIWGNLLDGGEGANLGLTASAPYPKPEWIRTYSEFFKNRFLKDLVRDNSITDGVCLKRPTNTHYIFYKENATAIQMNLAGMEGIQSAIAVDTKLPYIELNLGDLFPYDQTWTAPYSSDWAVAVGTFGTKPPIALLQKPMIHSFQPDNGFPGTEITIIGSEFKGILNVSFNGTSALNFTADSETRIRVQVPQYAATGLLSVSNAAGTALSGSNFEVIEPPEARTFKPDDDTFIRSNYPQINYGKFTELRVRHSASAEQISFLKFVILGTTQQPSRAILRLKVLDASDDGGALYLVPNYYKDTNTPWTEEGLVWDNAPITPGTSITAVDSVNIDATIEFDVTSSITGNGIYSFAIKNASPNAAKYSSKEGVQAPELIVESSYWTSPYPEITSFTPEYGVVGTEVTLTGLNFITARDVLFNGMSASKFNVDSDTQIRAKVPSGTHNGKISIRNMYGMGLSFNNFVMVSKPVIKSFQPEQGEAGTEVTITGDNFIGVSSIKFYKISSVNFEMVSSTQVRTVVPAGAQTGRISVTNPAGTSLSIEEFTVLRPPYITSFTPLKGKVGTVVTITGGNFHSVNSVFFHTHPASTYSVINDNEIHVVVPEDAVSGLLQVSNSDGAGESPVEFEVLHPPAIHSFFPKSGVAGDTVSIAGKNFSTAKKLYFNKTLATSFIVLSDTLIITKVPIDAESGKLSLTNEDGMGKSMDDFTVIGIPAIFSFQPESGVFGQEITITGNNFIALTDILFNGKVSVNFKVDSNSKLRAKVPPTATTGKISVKNAAGTGRSEDDFIVLVSPIQMSFTPTDDATIRSNKSSSIYGNQLELRLRQTNSAELYSFLKFSVAGLKKPPESARLLLYVTDEGSDGGSVYSVSNNYKNALSAWTEDSLSWSNAPEISGLPLMNIGQVNLHEVIELDVTNVITGEGTYSFGLKNSSPDAVKFSSKEGSHPPELYIRTKADTLFSAHELQLNSTNTESNKVMVHESKDLIPTNLHLNPNYPNPFNLKTTIEYAIPIANKIHLVIYNIKGQEVRTLINEFQVAGFKRIRWNGVDNQGTEVSSGLYFMQLKVGNQSLFRKIILQK